MLLQSSLELTGTCNRTWLAWLPIIQLSGSHLDVWRHKQINCLHRRNLEYSTNCVFFRCYGVIVDEEPFLLVMEFVNGGSLESLLIDRAKRGPYFNDSDRLEIVKQIASGR